jgi:hypothetical protein
MGQLDDAIREHLELKRSRGADPTEVAREEQEALGPVRRETEPPARPAPAEPDLEADELDEEDRDDEAEADPSEEATRLHRVEEEHDPEPDPPRSPVGARRLEPDEDFEWDPQERSEQADAAEPEAPGDQEAEEDVLEETPEFLQETPEHDRLWFEQRPPRDFDWDK